MQISTKVAVVLVAVWATSLACAANHDEAVDGDLSGNRLLPTVLALQPGSNLVQGSFGRSPVPDVADLDYLRVDIVVGSRLTELRLTQLVAGGSNSFLGVQAGPVLTLPPTGTDPGPLLGWAHLFSNQQGQDVLPALGIQGGLAAGSYTFWINETDTSATWSYGFDFRVAPVPEPGMASLLGLGSCLVAALGRRRGRCG